MSELLFSACLNCYSKVADSRVLWERRSFPRSDDRIWLCSIADLVVRTLYVGRTHCGWEEIKEASIYLQYKARSTLPLRGHVCYYHGHRTTD
jgi:hypothetical protein